MFSKINKLIATFFYVGLFPLAPGSLASLVGGLIYVVLYGYWAIYVLIFVLITFLGFFSAGRIERELNQKDPSCVVIDEVSGMMIALFLLPLKIPVLITALFLFRAFDMFKIYPANRLEKLHGGRGIMMDDIMAGIYTNVIMHIALAMSKLI